MILRLFALLVVLGFAVPKAQAEDAVTFWQEARQCTQDSDCMAMKSVCGNDWIPVNKQYETKARERMNMPPLPACAPVAVDIGPAPLFVCISDTCKVGP
jgi:hypothetical protein